MGRLFWKFFGFIWLAQLAGIATTASSFWFMQSRAERLFTALDSGPGAGTQVAAAAEIYRYGGVAGFREWEQSQPGPGVYAVDAGGRDLLGRTVPPALLSLAEQTKSTWGGQALVREAALPGGGPRYLFFSRGAGSRGPAGDRPPRPRSGPGPRGFPPLPAVLVTLLASLGTALLLAWYVAKPIRSLRLAFRTVAAGNLTFRVEPSIGGRRDELADLGRDFDRMTNRLQASMEGQRRLLHDVSHEMRSPLARLQAATGLIRLKVGQEPTVDRIEEEIVRIDHLVGDLLTLSRLEAGELTGAEEDVDMQELLRAILEDANFEAQAQDRCVLWGAETPGVVSGRPEMLHAAIENVVRNALKHAPLTREILVETTIDEAAGLFVLRVIDSGPGVPVHELPGLFTPFFRAADSARTDGYGLGLAIARRSVEAHGGTIEAANRPEGGLVVSVALPLKS